MPESIAKTVQKVIQDLVAPDVRELKTLVSALQRQVDQRFESQDEKINSLQKHMEQRFDAQDQKFSQRFDAQDQKINTLERHMDQRFDAQAQKSDDQFKALMAAFGEFRAQSELATIRVISQLSERVAVLEAKRL